MVSRKLLIMIGISTVIGLAVGDILGSYLTGLMSRSREEQLINEIKRLQDQLGLPPVEEEVRIFNWSWYINEYVIELFKKAYGVQKVIYKTFESDEEVWTKLSTGASGYDVVVMADSFVGMAIRDNLIEPLDHRLIPNFQYIDERFKNQSFDVENQYSVPYMWGTTGIGYDSRLVTDPITGWEQLFDFRPNGFLEKYKGKITMLDDLYETIPAALVYLGYSTNDVDPTHLEQAKNLLIQQKKYLLKYAGADLYIPMLTNPETSKFWISHVWNGDLYVSKDTNPNLRFVLPEEGGVWWIDNMIIPKGVLHPVAAHAWINFMSDPLVAAINTETIHYANPNKVANENLIPKPVVNDPGLYPTPEQLAKFELGKMYTDEERLRLEEVWTSVKIAPTG